MRPNIYLAIVIILVTASCGSRSSHKPTAVYFQSPPPDMVFVPGNGQVPGFYMGAGEETNLNYNIYLKWLDRVYTEYPDIIEWSAPSYDVFKDTAILFNDPVYREYFTHP